MTRLRVLTANLWNGRADPDRFEELLRALDLDAVAVQELAPEQARAIERVLGHGKLEPAVDHCGMGIALRHPAAIRRLSLPNRDVWIAELEPGDWPGLPETLELLNAHVLAPIDRPLWRTLAVRRAQLRGLLAYLDAAAPRPRILVGDLNSTPIWPVYRRLAERLEDAALRAAQRSRRRLARTWGPRPNGPRLLRIDHVLVRGLEVTEVDVIRIPGSDHSAVLCELEL